MTFEPQIVQAGPTPPARQRVGGGGRGEGTSQRGNQRGLEAGSAVGGWFDVDVFFLTMFFLDHNNVDACDHVQIFQEVV